MTVERTLHCDEKDCNTNGSDQYPHWLILTSTGDMEPLHFCNGDCLFKWAAANSEPPTVIPFGPLDEKEAQ